MDRRRFLGGVVGAGLAFALSPVLNDCSIKEQQGSKKKPVLSKEYRNPVQFKELAFDYFARYQRVDPTQSGVTARLHCYQGSEPYVFLDLVAVNRYAPIGDHLTAYHPKHFGVTSQRELADAMAGILAEFPGVKIKREI